MQKTGNKLFNFFALSTLLFTAEGYALGEHEFDLGLRGRYTDVSEAENNGRAASLLVRLDWEAKWNPQLSTLVEFDSAETWFQDEHRDGLRFNNEPLVPDVPGDEINQAFLQWRSGQWQTRIGRQRIELANQRFIGSVSFWQNDQTYDALRLRYAFLSNTNLQYIYIDNVNRFWGEDAGTRLRPSDINFDALMGIRPAPTLGDHEQDTHLLHLEIKEWDYSQVLAWHYDIENKTAAILSNTTSGIGYRFNHKASTIKYMLEADIAMQERDPLGDNSIPYHRLEVGLGFDSLELHLSQENLGSDNGASFITPLGSIVDFQGWADAFFITPPDGVVDKRLQLDWRFNPFRLDARYHFFESYETGDDFGTELDIDLTWKATDDQTLILRLSNFENNSVRFEDYKSLSLTWSYNL